VIFGKTAVAREMRAADFASLMNGMPSLPRAAGVRRLKTIRLLFPDLSINNPMTHNPQNRQKMNNTPNGFLDGTEGTLSSSTV
jgi:hypothetical protein